MAVRKVVPLAAVDQLAAVLDSPEIAVLVSEPEATRWTGRLGLDRVTDALRAQRPEMGENDAIDGSDMPAYANGQYQPKSRWIKADRLHPLIPRESERPTQPVPLTRCR